ncbi:MAG: component of SufBCD complex [Brevirhabdus sp.]
MRSIAAIRTNKWTGEEERMLSRLRQAFGDDVAVVFHKRPEDVTPPVDVVDLTAEWARDHDLRMTRDWGWRCGDYFYYALREAKPDYDFYWLVEPDLLFTGDPSDFFGAFDSDETDLLGVDPEPFAEANHPFLQGLKGMAPHRAIFALTRFSGRALDKLLPLRVANGKVDVGPRAFTNDELFCFSNVAADSDLTLGTLTKAAPSWFDGARVSTDPDLLIDALEEDPTLEDKVFHPVRGKDAFKDGVADRLASRLGYLQKMGGSWAHLDDADLDDIAARAHDRIRAALHRAKRTA